MIWDEKKVHGLLEFSCRLILTRYLFFVALCVCIIVLDLYLFRCKLNNLISSDNITPRQTSIHKISNKSWHTPEDRSLKAVHALLHGTIAPALRPHFLYGSLSASHTSQENLQQRRG